MWRAHNFRDNIKLFQIAFSSWNVRLDNVTSSSFGDTMVGIYHIVGGCVKHSFLAPIPTHVVTF